VLNETRFDQSGAEPSTIHYFTSGATANSYYFDEYYFGNPGFYKTYFLGINDACLHEAPDPDATFLDLRSADIPFDPADRAVAAFRARAAVNTYAETGALGVPDDVIRAFQIGPSRILTRTAPPGLSED
jgi:hypothetical protein